MNTLLSSTEKKNKHKMFGAILKVLLLDVNECIQHVPWLNIEA